MRRSSAAANQRELDFGGTEVSPSSSDSHSTLAALDAPATGQQSGTASTGGAPSIAGDSLYALTARRAGRLNALNIPEREVDDLLRERQQLLDKQFAETITKAERIRLQYVRWSLDRIDDARYGETLDRLESWIAEYERFGNKIESLLEDLGTLKPKSK
jgi:hypothetical protein